MTNYPDSCLRALQKREWWIAGTQMVDRAAFEPEMKQNRMRIRSDDYLETSIDWEDDADTIVKMNRRSIAQFGVIRLRRESIENVILDNARREDTRDKLTYERCVEDDNLSHGNLLFARMPTPLIKAIAGMLAWEATIVILKNMGK